MVHSENRVSIIGQIVWVVASYGVFGKLASPGINGAFDTAGFRIMEMRTGFFQLVSAVVGLSVGVGVMTATVILGVAALLQ